MKTRDLPCGCCEGPDILTPQPSANRPGLDRLRYRAGDHGAFLETMLARLASHDLTALRRLTTREPSDPAIALLDAWAAVADVLTFYDERIANEGYLRTATERRSVLELARLVGYALRPGVAATVFLAFGIEPTFEGEALLKAPLRAQSVPGPGELPQTFEIVAPLKARAAWNTLQPRLTQPQTERSIRCSRRDGQRWPRIYLSGVAANLRPNDAVEIAFPGSSPTYYRVDRAEVDATAGRTLVTLLPWAGTADPCPAEAPVGIAMAATEVKEGIARTLDSLTQPPSLHPASPQRVGSTISGLYAADTDVAHRILGRLVPEAGDRIQVAVANAAVTPQQGITCEVYRGKAALFTHNHPGKPVYTKDPNNDMLVKLLRYDPLTLDEAWDAYASRETLQQTLVLDGEFSLIKSGGKVLVVLPNLRDNNLKVIAEGFPVTCPVQAVDAVTLPVFGISTKCTVLTIARGSIPEAYLEVMLNNDLFIARSDFLKGTTVYILPEALELAEEPLTDPVCRGTNEEIELNGLYRDLQPGRWVIVAGERTDVMGARGTIPGIQAAEVAMLSAVTQKVKQVANMQNEPEDLRGDKVHTFIQLADDLAYCYKRDTVKIYGNVAKATHGETRPEVLGNGDASKPLQAFTLKQPPLTFVSAATPAGAASTLKVYVNDVEWHEAESLGELGPNDRRFVSKTGDDGKTSITFGNGTRGARPPTGLENVRTVYRNGIGRPGNVKAGQITTAMDRPQGLKDVVNPRPATGGADPEDRDSARTNVPLAVAALDRLVAVADYADFARTFAGIGKASAVKLSDGRRPVVHVTIAGVDDIAIDETSDLYRNLRRALSDYGDPYLPVQLAVRDLRLVVLAARVQLCPDYVWEPVEAKLRAALLDGLGFRKRALGQDLLLGEVLAVMQAVRGVAYVDVDTLDALGQATVQAAVPVLAPDKRSDKTLAELLSAGRRERVPIHPARYVGQLGAIVPAQIAYLSPDVPETLVLNLIEELP